MLAQKQIDFLNYVCKGKWTEIDSVINVDGTVNILKMNLTEIPIQFGRVDGDFNCCYNKLTTLKGSPSKVQGKFDCSHNILTSLKGGPKEVGYYLCVCNLLTSLKGAPEICLGFCCSRNQLTSLEGCPKLIKGDLWCIHNPNLHILYGINRIGGGIFYDNRNDLNEWIINENRKNILLSDRDIISWIQDNRRLEFLHKVPEKIAEYFSKYIIEAIELKLC